MFFAGKVVFSFAFRTFDRILLSGLLNNYLTRPVNSYFYSSIKNINGANILTFFIFLFVGVGMLIISDYVNFFLAFIIGVLGIIYYIFFTNFFCSICFFIKRGDFIGGFMRTINYFNEEYTPIIFEQSFLKWLFFLMPSSIYGFFVIEILKGRTELFYSFLPYFILTFVIFVVGIFMLWHYGLKRYEAFG